MRAIKINRFVEEEDNIEWLVEGLLPNTGWTLLVGQAGLGKTTFAMQMCSALQDGIDFLGRKTKQTDVLYLQADSPTIEWRAMLKRISPKSNGWTVVDVPSKCLDNPSYIEAIKIAVSRVQPRLIVFDSLYNLTSKNINTEQVLIPVETMKLLSVINDQPVPFILIHHPPHSENRASGHNSLPGNASNVWILLKSKLKIEKGRLHGNKEILLKRDDNGLWIEKVDNAIEGLDDFPTFGKGFK